MLGSSDLLLLTSRPNGIWCTSSVLSSYFLGRAINYTFRKLCSGNLKDSFIFTKPLGRVFMRGLVNLSNLDVSWMISELRLAAEYSSNQVTFTDPVNRTNQFMEHKEYSREH